MVRSRRDGRLQVGQPGPERLAGNQAFRERRDIIVEGLNNLPGVTCVKPKGAFYAFPNITETGKKSRELAEKLGVTTYMIDSVEELDPTWLEGKRRIGLTAGASAPEVLVQAVVSRLRELGAREVRELDGLVEEIPFRETRTYVKKVMSLTAQYAVELGEPLEDLVRLQIDSTILNNIDF